MFSRYFRAVIAIAVLLGIILSAQGQMAWAAAPLFGDQASDLQAGLSISPAADNEDCEKDNRNQNKCKDKDKDKCKPKDNNCGTVQPPPGSAEICERGNYSVGGVATLDVNNVRDRGQDDDCFNAHTEDSDTVSGLPQRAGPPLSDQLVLTSVGQGTNMKVCFAAPPGKKVRIYYFDGNSWKALGTSTKNGIACAPDQGSGSYVLAAH